MFCLLRSHEIVFNFSHSCESSSCFISIVSVIISTHLVLDHASVVISVITFSTSTFQDGFFNSHGISFLSTCSSSGSLSFLFFFVDFGDVIKNLFNLLGITVIFKIFAKCLVEILNSVRSCSVIQNFSCLLTELGVIFLVVKFHYCRQSFGFIFSLEKLVDHSFLCILFKFDTFSSSAQSFQVVCLDSCGSSSVLFLSLFKRSIRVKLSILVLNSSFSLSRFFRFFLFSFLF